MTIASAIDMRRANVEDLPILIANVQAGFDSYVDFAPRGWEAPNAGGAAARMAVHLADAGTWALLALSDGEPVGHVAFTIAREGRIGERRSTKPVIPGLAHLWQLFVLPEWWGRNVATLLHDRAIAEMRNRDFSTARLNTPALHARARRFYERRGWRAVDEQWSDDLELMLTEYRLALTVAGDRRASG